MSPVSEKRIQFFPEAGSFFRPKTSAANFSEIFCLLGSLQNLEAIISLVKMPLYISSYVNNPSNALTWFAIFSFTQDKLISSRTCLIFFFTSFFFLLFYMFNKVHIIPF